MIKKNLIYSSILYWFIIIPVLSQNEGNWMKFNKRMVLEKVMNIEYTHPTGFIGDSTIVFCSELSYLIGVEGRLASEDLSFIVFYRIFSPVSSFNPMPDSIEDTKHIKLAEHIVNEYFGEDADWKEHFRYYSSDDAKAKFNADTVLYISLLLKKDQDYYDDKLNEHNYSHCKIIIIQKKGRGIVPIYCIYNEKAEKNLDLYMAMIETSLRYREGEPELKSWDGDHDIIFKVKPKQPKLKNIDDTQIIK